MFNIEYWFEGVVVPGGLDDPLKMGRVKVREIIGHSDRVSDDEITWCHVIMPPHSANAKGIGISPIGLSENSKVIGFKQKGSSTRLILGSHILGQPDGQGDDDKYSLSRYAREKGPVEKPLQVPELGERKSEYAAKYPYNKTITTQSGHVLELDDTPKAERIHIYHKSGAYVEIFPDGSIVTKSMKDSVSVTMNDHSISVVKGDLQIVANEGKIQINSNGDIDLVSKTGVVNIQAPVIGLNG
jgi:hypothetical protein